jgi:hypothetical protein
MTITIGKVVKICHASLSLSRPYHKLPLLGPVSTLNAEKLLPEKFRGKKKKEM